MFKLGRNRPTSRPPMLRLRNYMLSDLPPPPVTIDYAPRVAERLGMVLGNDTLGNCTAAGAGHLVDVFHGNLSTPGRLVDVADTIAFYSATTGYNPADPSTDQGGDEITVLNYWRDKGFFSDGTGKISAYISVDATNQIEVEIAMWLFESLYFGVELPDAYVNPFPSGGGFTWEVAGDSVPSNGHCFVGVGYNDVGVRIDTWGLIGTMTYGAVAKYASRAGNGELYTVLSAEAIDKATAKAPNGFDFATLQEHLQALR